MASDSHKLLYYCMYCVTRTIRPTRTRYVCNKTAGKPMFRTAVRAVKEGTFWKEAAYYMYGRRNVLEGSCLLYLWKKEGSGRKLFICIVEP